MANLDILLVLICLVAKQRDFEFFNFAFEMLDIFDGENLFMNLAIFFRHTFFNYFRLASLHTLNFNSTSFFGSYP